MDILMKSRGKWRTCVQDPMGNWFFQHMEAMNTTKWQSEDQMLEVLCKQMKMAADTLISADSAELSDFLSEDNLMSETDVLLSQHEVNSDIHLDCNEKLQSDALSQGAPTPMRETVQLIKEQLKEANLAREQEEEELRQSVKCIQETFKAELQVEREMKQHLQEQLKEARLSHQQECVVHRNELKNIQQQVETFQAKLEQEVKEHELLQKKHEELKQSLKYSQESLTSMLQAERKMKQLLQEQLKEAKHSYQEDTIKYMTELKSVQQQADALKSQLQREVEQKTLLYKEHEELKQSIECLQETFIAELQAERDMKQLHDEQLKEAKLSYERECIMYRNELENVQKQAENVQHELEQEVKQNQVFKKEHEELKQSLQSSQAALTSLLHSEKTMKQLLEEQLKETKLSHQQECAQYRIELENVQRQADDLKCQLQEEVEHRTLHREQEEQNQSVGSIQEALKAELQVEREMKQLLQEQLKECVMYRAELEKFQKQAETVQLELEQETEQKKLLQIENRELQQSLQYTLEAKLSYQQECNKYRTELKNVQKQAEHLKCQLQREVQQRTIFQEVHEEMKQSLKCSQRSYAFLLQAEREMSQLLQKELNEVRRSSFQDCLKYKTQITDAEQVADGHEHETEKEIEEKELLQKEHEELRDITPQKLQSEHIFKKLVQTIEPGFEQKVEVENLPQKMKEETCGEDGVTAGTELTNNQRQDDASQPGPEKDVQQMTVLHKKESLTEEEHKDTSEQETVVGEIKEVNAQTNLLEEEILSRTFSREHEETWNRETLVELQVDAVGKNLLEGGPLPVLISCHEENLPREENEETSIHDTSTEEFQVLSVQNHLLEDILLDYNSCYEDTISQEHEETSNQETLAEEFQMVTVGNNFPEEDILFDYNLCYEDTLPQEHEASNKQFQMDFVPHNALKEGMLLDYHSCHEDILSQVEHEEAYNKETLSEELQVKMVQGNLCEGEMLLHDGSSLETFNQQTSEDIDSNDNEFLRQLDVLSCSSDEECFGFLETPCGNRHHSLPAVEIKEA